MDPSRKNMAVSSPKNPVNGPDFGKRTNAFVFASLATENWELGTVFKMAN